jgi:hypothetical protein
MNSYDNSRWVMHLPGPGIALNRPPRFNEPEIPTKKVWVYAHTHTFFGDFPHLAKWLRRFQYNLQKRQLQ